MHWNIAGKRARRSINSQGRAMALEAFALGASCRRFKPHLFMVLVQAASALLYFITEAAFNNGLNTHVYVTYRHIVGGIVVLPFAYFLERKVRPKLTFVMFVEIFLLSLLGVGLTVNMYFASMRYTSPAFVSATINTIPSLTFILSVIFRLEALDVRDSHGLAKVIGTAFSLIGAMSLTLYRGKEIRCLWNSPIHLTRSTFHKDWIKGSVLCVASCIAWSIWFTAQHVSIILFYVPVKSIVPNQTLHELQMQRKGFLLKRYPAQLSLTTWVNFLGAAQSAVFTAIAIRREPVAWSCTSLIDLGAIFFAGILSSGLNSSMLIWCTKEKGPVFVTMFCPLQTLLVVVFAYFFLSERLYMGSFVGGVTIIMGLYLLLWGKGGDQELCIKSQEPSHSSCNYQNESKMKIVTAPDKDGPQSTLNKL